MQRKDPVVVNLMKRLSDQDVLTYRSVCKRWRDLAKAYTDAPYKTKAQFATALSGVYITVLKFILGMDIYYNVNTSHLAAAWSIYQSTRTSSSHLPCMIYRMSDYRAISKTLFYPQFCGGEDVIGTGRRYNPVSIHNWAVNQAWLLAQIHRGREACLLSPVTALSIFRSSDHQTGGAEKKHSAFIREIAALMKVGYVPVRRNGDIYLVPDKNIQKTDITYDMLTPAKQDVEKAVNMISLFH